MTEEEPAKATAAAATAPDEGGISASVERATKQTRDAATWLIGAFAAIAGILVAGSQLSDMGELAAWSGRWWAAVAGLSVALVGILAAVLGALTILLPARSTLSDAARDDGFVRWVDNHTELLAPDATSVEHFRGQYFAARREYDSAMDAYESAEAQGAVPEAVSTRAKRADARFAEIEAWATIINDAHTDRRFRRAAQGGFVAIFIGGLLAAIGIASFAWAAHPGDKSAKDEPAAEAPVAPVRVRLALTAVGKEIIREATSCDAAQAEAVRIGGDTATPELLILPREGCKAVRLTLSDTAGEAVEPG